MKRVSSSEYISSINKRTSWPGIFVFLLAIATFLAIVGFVLLFYLVKTNNVLLIPKDAQEYLLYNYFFEFSSTELQKILLIEVGDTSYLTTLLGIYWVDQFLGLIMVVGSIILIISITRGSSRSLLASAYGYSPRKSLLILDNLQKYTLRYTRNPTKYNRFRLNAAIPNRRGFFKSISPIYQRWHKYPEHQWLSIKSFNQETRLILFSLSNLFRAFRNEINEDKDLSVYIPLFKLLEEFFLSILNRTVEDLKITDINEDLKEQDILIKFSKDARPIITRALFPRKDVKPEAKYKQYINQVIESMAVRGAIIISGVAAIVMILGVIIFRIDSTQAFLTWFTVTFGSLTISLGAASLTLFGKRNHEPPKSE